MDPPPSWATESEIARVSCWKIKRGEVSMDEMNYQRQCLVMEAMDKQLEVDEKGLDQHAPGAKMDLGKVDIFRHFLAMFPRATECTAWVAEYGERKYTYMGWSQVEDGIRRYTAAMNRHILDEAKGEKYDIDPDKGSDLAHAAQVAWNAMARLELMIREGEVEIRRGREIKK